MFNCAHIPTSVSFTSQWWTYFVKFKSDKWQEGGTVGPCKPTDAFEMVSKNFIVPLEPEQVSLVALDFKGNKTMLPQEEGVSGYNL